MIDFGIVDVMMGLRCDGGLKVFGQKMTRERLSILQQQKTDKEGSTRIQQATIKRKRFWDGMLRVPELKKRNAAASSADVPSTNWGAYPPPT
jgi:hypothetical protein